MIRNTIERKSEMGYDTKELEEELAELIRAKDPTYRKANHYEW